MADGTGTTDPGGVFPWSRVDDGINKDLEWVLVGEKVDDFEAVLDDGDGLQFLTDKNPARTVHMTCNFLIPYPIGTSLLAPQTNPSMVMLLVASSILAWSVSSSQGLISKRTDVFAMT